MMQDAYTLRCVPQVHGVVHDTVDFVRGIIGTELNAATDNPLVFADRGEIISGGNFHGASLRAPSCATRPGEYPAKALDYLAIGIHELAQISERRLERLMNPHLSGLPAFLTKDGGLNSGYMMVQVTAAGLGECASPAIIDPPVQSPRTRCSATRPRWTASRRAATRRTTSPWAGSPRASVST